MSFKRGLQISALAVVLLVLPAKWAEAQFDELLKRVPSDANADFRIDSCLPKTRRTR